MSELTSAILTQIAVKRLSGKAMSSGKLSIAGEALGSTVQSSATTIFGEVVPNAPLSSSAMAYVVQSASVSDPGTVQLVKFDLLAVNGTEYRNDSGTEVGTISGITDYTISPRAGFDAALGDIPNFGTIDTFHAYTIKLPSNYETLSTNAGFVGNASTPKTLGTDAPFTNGFNSTGSVQMQVVPEYLSTITGTSNKYIPKVISTTDVVMSVGSAIDYYFDAMAGVLFVADPTIDNTNPESPPSNVNQPGKLEAFLYVGKYQSETSGDTVSLHFSASAGTGFTITNNATASFTTGSGDGLTITAGATNDIEFELVNVVSSSQQVQDGLSGVSLFRISSSTGTDDIDLQFGQTASFVDGGAGLTVKATGNTSKTIEIGATGDSVTFRNLTITETASIALFHSEFVSSSIIFESGSTKFGDTSDDFHDFTGSLNLSGSQFRWTTPTANASRSPLVYDASTNTIHTGSDYALSADGMTQFQVSASSLIGNTTTENGNFAVTNENTIRFSASGGLSITASSGDSISISAGLLSESIQTNVANITTLTNASASFAADIISATASITTLTNASASFATDITNATASISTLINASASFAADIISATASITTLTNASASFASSITTLINASASFATDIANATASITTLVNASASFAADILSATASIEALVASASAGIHFNTGSGALGGTSIPLGTTASFVGGNGITVTNSNGILTFATSSNVNAVAALSMSIQDNQDNVYKALVFADPSTGTAALQTDAAALKFNPGLGTNGTLKIDGDLVVNGTTTSIDTTNLLVEDRFILLASGSATNTVGGGIVVERSAQNIGTALFWDETEDVWAVDLAGADASSAATKTIDFNLVGVKQASGNPSNASPPAMGVSNYKLGQMYVNTTDTDGDGNTIWIYAT